MEGQEEESEMSKALKEREKRRVFQEERKNNKVKKGKIEKEAIIKRFQFPLKVPKRLRVRARAKRRLPKIKNQTKPGQKKLFITRNMEEIIKRQKKKKKKIHWHVPKVRRRETIVYLQAKETLKDIAKEKERSPDPREK